MLRYILQSFESVSLSVQEKMRKIDFQDSCNGGDLGFLIRTILAFILSARYPEISFQVLRHLAFSVCWPFKSGEEAHNRFSSWRPWSWISDRNDFDDV